MSILCTHFLASIPKSNKVVLVKKMFCVFMLLNIVAFSTQQPTGSTPKINIPSSESNPSSSSLFPVNPSTAEDQFVPGCKALNSRSGQSEPLTSGDEWIKFKHHLEDYAQFHHQQLQKLKSGNRHIRTLSWSCFSPVSCGGIGDQLYNIQQALVYAIISQRVLSLHWNPTSYKTMKYLRPNKIDWTYFNETQGMQTHHSKDQYRVGIPRTVEYYEPFYKQLLSEDHIHMTVNHELQVPFIRGIRMAATSANINKTLAQFGITKLLIDSDNSTSIPLEMFSGELLRYLFHFEKTIIDKVEQVQQKLGVLDTPYLAIHMRTGFFGMEQDEGSRLHSRKAFRNPIDWDKTITCSIKLSNQLFGKKHPIYLATDSNVVKKLAVTKYGRKIKVAHFALQHVALTKHNLSQYLRNESQEQITNFTQGSRSLAMDSANSVSVDDIDGHMSSWVDFLLMARSSALVHSISGFSVTAGQFCSIRSQYHVPNCAPRVKQRQY